MNILVTGGAGFIASHIADKLLAMDNKVVVLDNLVSGYRHNVPDSATFVEGDISDPTLVPDILKEHGIEVIIHHAAQMDVRKSVDDPAFDATINILGTLNLLEAARLNNVRKFVFASTGGAIYGEQDFFPADESHSTNPVSPYGISKLASEKYIHYYHVQYGLEYSILRYANVYGPRQNPHGEAGVVAIFCKMLLAGKQVTINGDGLQSRDYVYVADIVDANIRALEHGEPLLANVGTGIETDVVQLYQHLADAADSKISAGHGPGKPGEQRRSVISASRLSDATGWKPTVTIEEGLRKTFAAFKESASKKD